MAVEAIRLLGAVEVDRDDETVRPRGELAPALVARLALSAGDLVTSEQLVRDVWSDAPDALVTLRAHLSRLRTSALGDALKGVKGGYVLDVDPERVDVLALRQRIDALPEPSADDGLLSELVDLAARCDAHLAAGVDGPPFLRAAREALADDRRRVEEDLAETALALGDAALATSVLEGTASRHPAHERPARLLATALARSSRYSEALDVLDSHAARLAADGLEVSPRIAAVRRDIVRLEPAVVAPRSPDGSVTRVGVQMPLTRLIGRGHALARLRSARAESRLVTIVGPAGVGKTRIALELAREATTALDDEQYMVDLAEVRHEDAVLPVVAASVRATTPSVDAVAQRLQGRRVLVILDNADHVLGGVATTASALLERAADVRLLVTSREPLRVEAEREVVLKPLVGDEAEDAWRLFAERTADVRGGEPLDGEEEEQARELCAELEGIPLALELAAAHLDVLDVESVREGLRLGSDGGRHGSVQSAIAWSFGLLSPAERTALVHAGRFAGPFTVDVFAGVEEMAPEEADGLLRALVGKSLLVPERSDNGRPRLRMLESTREFVARLDAEADPDEIRDWVGRHRRWFAWRSWSLAPTLRAFEARDTMAVLDGFSADLDAAMDSATVSGDRTSAVLLTAGMAQYWHLRGRFEEGRRRLSQAIALPDGPREGAAAEAFPSALATAELELANLAYQLGDAETAFTAIMAAEAHGRAAGDASATAVALARAGFGRSLFGDPDTGRALLDAALATAEAAEPWARAEVLMSEGQVQRALQDPAAAIRALTESHRIAAGIGYTWMVSSSRYLLAKALVDSRRPREAIGVARETALWARSAEDAAGTLALLHIVAGACAYVERHEAGARLFGALDALGERYGYSTETAEGEEATRLREAVSAGLPTGEYEREYAAGRRLDWDGVMSLVDSLPRVDPVDDAGPATAASS